MPVAKAAKAKSVRKSVRLQKRPADPELDLVSVRATAEGYYAHREVLQERYSNPKDNKYYIGREEIQRNPGEVFYMDTHDMKQFEEVEKGEKTRDDFIAPHTGKYYLNQKHLDGAPMLAPVPFDAEFVETERGEFVLPWWATLADAKEDVSPPAGHPNSFGRHSPAVGEVL